MDTVPTSSNFGTPLHFLLADDDTDDHFFFDKVLKQLKISTKLTTVDEDEQLVTFVSENYDRLPDITSHQR